MHHTTSEFKRACRPSRTKLPNLWEEENTASFARNPAVEYRKCGADIRRRSQSHGILVSFRAVSRIFRVHRSRDRCRKEKIIYSLGAPSIPRPAERARPETWRPRPCVIVMQYAAAVSPAVWVQGESRSKRKEFLYRRLSTCREEYAGVFQLAGILCPLKEIEPRDVSGVGEARLIIKISPCGLESSLALEERHMVLDSSEGEKDGADGLANVFFARAQTFPLGSMDA
ncbi:hypothetical protein B0H13DRAFT_2520798 [Mycena leptocephala]|nr:hypothetical protein B0H13DRAFT_2520798 [Mycena leptocephala]